MARGSTPLIPPMKKHLKALVFIDKGDRTICRFINKPDRIKGLNCVDKLILLCDSLERKKYEDQIQIYLQSVKLAGEYSFINCHAEKLSSPIIFKK